MRRSEPIRRRSSLRLKGFDYSSAGAYFVTICAQHRLCLLGDVTDEAIRLNDAGTMVDRWWQELLGPFPTVELDEYVVMPNHIHGILWIQPAVTREGSAVDLSSIIQWFKTMTTNEYIVGVKTRGWEPFPGKLWQRRFFDHIIRDDDTLDKIRRYVRDNPRRWLSDPENPSNSNR